MNYLRFNPGPGPSGALDKDGLGVIPPGDIYRSATVVSLWRRSVLLETLREGETAWDFEIHGSARTDSFGGWFASARSLLPTRNLVIKGRYEPGARRELIREGLVLSDERPTMTRSEYLAFLATLARHSLFNLVPRPMRRGIRERFRAA